jgi:hypothetical protein
MNAHTYSESRRIAQAAARHADIENVEKTLREAFLAAAKTGDMMATATFAATTTDWTAPYVEGFTRPHRPQRVGEVFTESLSYGRGPTDDDALAVICLLAYGTTPAPVLAERARKLLAHMAGQWAYMNSGVEA